MKTLQHKTTPLSDRDELVIKHLCLWIEQRIHTQISMTQLVEQSGWPYQELVRRFQIYTGTTPFQWLRVMRNKPKQTHAT
jgi:AraC-like DNA-binding protein